jgi:hypothetical protein
MSKVFATSLQPSKKIVLLALADFANDEGKNIFPSVATIAKKSSLSHRSVQTIIGNFLHVGLLRVAKNPFGGAPGTTRHLEINLAALGQLMKLSLGENSAPVPETGAGDSREGAQTDEETGETPAPKPPDNRHQTTTTDEQPEPSSGGDAEDFDWPPQLDAEEREAIQAILTSDSNSHLQKQFSLDELRAALASREIPRKAAWVRTLLKKGIERTPAGKGFDRARNEQRERKDCQSHKPSKPKTADEKSADLERLRKMKEALKK